MKKRTRFNKEIFAVKLLKIVLFLVIIPSLVKAANFNYADFNWDKFSQENNNYWEDSCKKDDNDCRSNILENQKKFYTKLYKLLAKYEKKGYFIDDNIIIETVFFELTPSTFSDAYEEYKKEWGTSGSPYVVDEEDKEAEEDVDIDEQEAKDLENKYYKSERDTLKVLIKNMISYQADCYGIYGDALEVEAQDGTNAFTCESGVVTSIDGKNVCADKLNNYNLGFWQMPGNDEFLGTKTDDEKKQECLAHTGEYKEGTKFVTSNKKTVNLNNYWDFLINTSYFDNKAHLQFYFEQNVLKPAKVKCMTKNVCEDSLESKGLYDNYKEQIKNARKDIVEQIIYILQDYGILTYNVSSGGSLLENREYQRRNYYWPIGSDEVEDKNGTIIASKEPSSVEIKSYFGTRKIGEEEINHYGIDIKGEVGKTNVIAIYNGEVLTVENSSGANLNDGYGKYIVVSHSNGDYSIYANLDSISDNITVGKKVFRGEVLGTVGSSGSEESVLHFEIRSGSNNTSAAIDPLSVLSPTSPRPEFALGDFSTKETSLTKEEFSSSLRNYCNRRTCKEVMMSEFVNKADQVYDISISAGVNPELVVIRAMAEGFSPGKSRNNYWGMGCTNTGGINACRTYSSFEEGIRKFAANVTQYETASEMMMRYAYIGDYWYNPGGSGKGGCYYLPYIKEFMEPSLFSRATDACNGPTCTGSESTCVKTLDEDQIAYSKYQVQNVMGKFRTNIFGL